jgi:hypothetical protein
LRDQRSEEPVPAAQYHGGGGRLKPRPSRVPAELSLALLLVLVDQADSWMVGEQDGDDTEENVVYLRRRHEYAEARLLADTP